MIGAPVVSADLLLGHPVISSVMFSPPDSAGIGARVWGVLLVGVAFDWVRKLKSGLPTPAESTEWGGTGGRLFSSS